MKKINLMIAIILVASISFASAEVISNTAVSFCCEKANYGAWCQNAKQENCDTAFRVNPASCDATSFCKLGCCYNSNEGTCMESTPQLVCQQTNGTWADSATCEIPQCKMGCCVLGNQAAFVTLTRCKKLSAFYLPAGYATDFRTNIQSEAACVDIAQSQEKGACVYDEDFITTCKFTTRGECDALKGRKSGNSTNSNYSFHPDYLCSAEELGTNCGMTSNTMCVEGKDEVYFQDKCGNPANIYDASKLSDKAYWKKIVGKDKSCGSGNSNGNANSKGCGNCDYFSGSFCKQYDKTKDTSSPSYGNNMCRDLNCKNTVDGKSYRHGESWCVYDGPIGEGKDPAGSRYWKHVCIAGEEIVEPCADFRQEICFQDKIDTAKGTFQQAGCVVNKWQDCTSLATKDKCLNLNKGDCRWIEGVIGQDSLGKVNATPISTSSKDKEIKQLKPHGVCVPNVPPGLKFWQAGETEGICAKASAVCQVGFSKGLISSSKKCEVNCECLDAGWIAKRQEVCKSLGDCTGQDVKVNVKESVYKYIEDSSWGVSGTKIIATIAGAFSWMTGIESADASISDESSEVSDNIVDLTGDQELFQNIAQGNNKVEKQEIPSVAVGIVKDIGGKNE